MENDKIINIVRECIMLLYEDFKDAPQYYDEHEIDLHFGFYYLLCSKIPFLFQNDNLIDYYEGKREEFRGKRIWVEVETEKEYVNRRKNKNKGRYDIAIYGKEKEQKTPLIAIELKICRPAKKEIFLQDFKKLGDEENGVNHPIFIYFEHHKFDPEYERLFKELKSVYPKVDVFYFADDKYKEIKAENI